MATLMINPNGGKPKFWLRLNKTAIYGNVYNEYSTNKVRLLNVKRSATSATVADKEAKGYKKVFATIIDDNLSGVPLADLFMANRAFSGDPPVDVTDVKAVIGNAIWNHLYNLGKDVLVSAFSPTPQPPTPAKSKPKRKSLSIKSKAPSDPLLSW